jgi:putative ABC transport system substrate-binding protein
MRRRVLLAATAAAVLSPATVRAQQKAMPVIGYLHFATPGYTPTADAFLQGLRDKGYVEGRDVAIEYRWAEGRYGRLPAMATDLVNRKVDLIAAFGDPSTREAKRATSTIPIVFAVGSDPVATGLVANLARPGGNATGLSIFFTEVTSKRIELLSELVPRAREFAVLVNPNSPTAKPTIHWAQESARAKGVQIPIVKASNEAEIEAALKSLAELHADALVIGADPFFDSQRRQLVTLAANLKIPTMYFARESVVLGGLISYGTHLTAAYRQVGVYAGRVLNGEKPADLPVQQPTTFELVINLKTARTLGLDVPQSILARADEVIE